MNRELIFDLANIDLSDHSCQRDKQKWRRHMASLRNSQGIVDCNNEVNTNQLPIALLTQFENY